MQPMFVDTEGKVVVFPWLLAWMRARHYDITPIGDRRSAKVTDQILALLDGMDVVQTALPSIALLDYHPRTHDPVYTFLYWDALHKMHQEFRSRRLGDMLGVGQWIQEDHAGRVLYVIGRDDVSCVPVPLPGWDPVSDSVSVAESKVKTFLNAYSGCRMEFVKIPSRRYTEAQRKVGKA